MSLATNILKPHPKAISHILCQLWNKMTQVFISDWINQKVSKKSENKTTSLIKCVHNIKVL